MLTNAATGRPYSGINVLVLWGVVVAQDFPGQSCLTFAKPSRSRIVQLMLLN